MCGFFRVGVLEQRLDEDWIWNKHLSWERVINKSATALWAVWVSWIFTTGGSLPSHSSQCCYFRQSQSTLICLCVPLYVNGIQICEHFAETGSPSARPPGATQRGCTKWRHGDLPWYLPYCCDTGRKPLQVCVTISIRLNIFLYD